jgi:predicted helicase
MIPVWTYLENIIKEFNSWRAREHSYRPALKNLLEIINENILATNEPAREKCGAPDFIITDKKNIPRGYIEAKDIIPSILDDKKNQEQIKKYFDGELGYNFIHTDNLEFRFYRNKILVESIKIGEIQSNKIISKQENFEKLEMLLINFLNFKTQTITSSKKLSEIMAWKARMIKRVIYMTLINNKDIQTEIHSQFEIFKKILVHDLDETSFADIYAQTITYGLFTARLHDPTLPTFDRDEAAKLLPKSNPFLKKFFQSLRDDLDSRIVWIVDDLVEIFLACDVKKLLDWYGKTTSRNDPIIHFYEDFLASYDAKLRKSKWVYYTPEPVVNFMIRGVDYILKNDFNLSDWIADTSKITMEEDLQVVKWKMQKRKREVHKVQILDPATWTGTFLNDIIKYIYTTRFEWMTWIWKSYVDENLLPRLHGFEIMMASYAMAHLKLDLTLQETGYKNENQDRLGIYLTNSLEEQHEDTGTILASRLSTESNEANYIKKNIPIMTIIWNPPYSVSSQNKWTWILDLLKDYKKDLNERKINLDDDYIKFIRYGEQYIEKNGEWILAFITNNSYLDGITHRQMRKHLLETFDKIYIYDLHGNARKKETCPNGDIDQNVFDIMAWVSIIFAIKKKN